MNDTLIKELNDRSIGWVKGYRESGFERFSRLNIPSWKRLNLNGLDLPEYKGYDRLQVTGDGIDVENIMDCGMEEDIREIMQDGQAFGVDEKFVSMVDSFFNTGVVIRVPKGYNSSVPVMVHYPSDGDLILDQNVIIAEPFTSVSIIIDHEAISEAGAFHNGITRVIAKEGSKVNLMKVQRLSDTSFNFDSVIGITGRDAAINWSVVELGSAKSAVSYTTYMNEQGGENNTKGIFFVDDRRRLDLSFKVNHIAPNTTSDIDIRGALKDEAYSIFRGDLDIKRGAKKAKGNEKESVILLDRTVRSDAIPALKCAEDDVEAGHAASCEELDKNTLYYMMSRGLSLDEARMMLVEASFNPIIDAIPDDGLKNAIREVIKRRLTCGEDY
ncbi:MAG: Fe-S cluster assembly protein SufD [Thermoanaerobacteraceae bacterium]|nr:Fe-S cluster assembly protein SufD [Thermoanaerobacteraceae bacterium]